MLKAACGYAYPFSIDPFQCEFPFWSIWYGIIVPHPFLKVLELHPTSTAQDPLSCYPE